MPLSGAMSPCVGARPFTLTSQKARTENLQDFALQRRTVIAFPLPIVACKAQWQMSSLTTVPYVSSTVSLRDGMTLLLQDDAASSEW